jgi:hypothetical protein
MKPIAKAMAAALSTAACMAGADAALAHGKLRPAAVPAAQQRQAVIPSADGFVIQASVPARESIGGVSVMPAPVLTPASTVIRVGANIGLDAALLASPVIPSTPAPTKEPGNAHQ